MNLDDLKNNWKKLDNLKEGSKSLDHEQLKKIIRKKFSNNIIRIVLPEFIFFLIYTYWFVFFISFKDHFTSQTNLILAYIGIAKALALIILSIYSIRLLYKKNNLINTYYEAITDFRKQCIAFKKIHYTIAFLSINLLIICVILAPKVYSEYLSFNQTLYTSIIGSIIVLLFIWKVGNYYQKLIRQNEELIERLIDK